VLGALTPYRSLPEEARAKAASTVARVGPVVAAVDPQNGYLTVAALLASAPGDRPFTVQELQVLEREAARPRFEYPRKDAPEQLREMAKRFDPDHAGMWAALTALGAPVPVFRLWQRAQATQDPRLRARAAQALLLISKRLQHAGTTLEKSLALALEEQAAEIRLDEASVRSISERRQAFSEWQAATVAARKRLGTWPFAASWREWSPEDEIGYMQRLVE